MERIFYILGIPHTMIYPQELGVIKIQQWQNTIVPLEMSTKITY